jgi:hypothetical protein
MKTKTASILPSYLVPLASENLIKYPIKNWRM